MLIISRFGGRLGNILIQIMNCIADNIYNYKHNKIDFSIIKKQFPNLKYDTILKNFPDIMYFDFEETDEVIKASFFGSPYKYDAISLQYVVDTYMKPYIDYELDDTFGINFDTDLIIHIRSGDIWCSLFHLNKHIQPPYYFYKKIIDENTYNNIYILSEHTNINPVISKLLENYTNIHFLKNSMDIDFKIMLNAKYFVYANSTISGMISKLSHNKQKQYENSCWNSPTYKKYYQTIFTSMDEKIDLILNFQPSDII